jgi:hypothetical protein
MRWLRQWHRGPVTALIVAWVLGSGALLTLYFVAVARSIERDYTGMGFRLGATETQMHVNWLAMWPQLVGYYGVVVVVPPAVFWLLWRRARRAA